MKIEIRPYTDLSAAFCDELLLQDTEMFYGARNGTFEKAAELRKEQTKAEELLWGRLRKKQLAGFRFRRQHPIGKYIADFYCHKRKLVVEIDGNVHSKGNQIEHDERRTLEMNLSGINVVRVTNDEIYSNMDQVLYSIAQALAFSSPSGEIGKGQACRKGRDTPCHSQSPSSHHQTEKQTNI